MKKVFLRALLTSFLILPSWSVRAQYGNVVKTNVLSPLFRTANVAYERVLNDRRSLQLGFFYTGVRLAGTRFNGVGITPEYRFYLSDPGTAPGGFYLAPFARYRSFELRVDNTPGKATLRTIGGGLVVGYQLALRDRLALDFLLGPQFSIGNVRVGAGGLRENFPTGPLGSGVGLRSGISLGLGF